MVKLLKKILPSTIENIVRSIFNRYNSIVFINPMITRYLADYFDITYEHAICMLKVGSRLNREVWGIIGPKTEEEINRFYQVNPFYIFSLAYWHMSREQVKLRRKIVNQCKGKVLDYGAGIGDLSVDIVKAGFQVTYVDITGKTFNFAEWMIKKNNCSDVRMLRSKEDWELVWSKQYGTIICLDVIEHLSNAEEVLEKMAISLEKGGYLIITGLTCKGDTDDHPMHMKISFDPETLLSSYNIYKSKDYDWLWIKKQ